MSFLYSLVFKNPFTKLSDELRDFFLGVAFLYVQSATVVRDLPQGAVEREIENKSKI